MAADAGTPKVSRLASSPFFQADQKASASQSRSLSGVGKAAFVPAPAPTLGRANETQKPPVVSRSASASGKSAFVPVPGPTLGKSSANNVSSPASPTASGPAPALSRPPSEAQKPPVIPRSASASGKSAFVPVPGPSLGKSAGNGVASPSSPTVSKSNTEASEKAKLEREASDQRIVEEKAAREKAAKAAFEKATLAKAASEKAAAEKAVAEKAAAEKAVAEKAENAVLEKLKGDEPSPIEPTSPISKPARPVSRPSESLRSATASAVLSASSSPTSADSAKPKPIAKPTRQQSGVLSSSFVVASSTLVSDSPSTTETQSPATEAHSPKPSRPTRNGSSRGLEAIVGTEPTIEPAVSPKTQETNDQATQLEQDADPDDDDVDLDALELPLPPPPVPSPANNAAVLSNSGGSRKVVIQGWLQQSVSESTFMGRHLDMWKKRWVVLYEDGLAWYNAEEDFTSGKTCAGEEKINGPFDFISEADTLLSLTLGSHTMRLKTVTVENKHEWAAAFEEVNVAKMKMSTEFRDVEEKRAMELAKVLLATLEAPPPVKVFKGGWLLKQGGGTSSHTIMAFARSQWKKRWIVLDSSGFSYFDSDKSGERELGFIPFDNNFSFTNDRDLCFSFQSNSRVMPLKAETMASRGEWFEAMTAAKSAFALKRPETQEKKDFGVVELKAIEQKREEKLVDKNCIREGYLTKRGETRKSLKSRYFVLNPAELRYFKHPKDPKPIGTISLHNKAVAQASKEEAFTFFLVPSPGGRQFVLSAKDTQDQINWLEALKTSVPTMTVVKGVASSLLAFSAGRNFLQVTQRSTRSLKEGFMLKQGHLNKNWKRRYFVLEPTLLEYYKNPHDKHCKGSVGLGTDGDSATAETDVRFTVVAGNGKKVTLVLCCESPVELLAWLAALQQIRQLTVNTHTGGKRSQRVVKSQSAYSIESAMAPAKMGLKRAKDI